MVMSSGSTLFLRREWLSKSALASVGMPIRKGFNLLFRSLAFSLGRVMCLQLQTGICSREGIEPVPRGVFNCG